MRGIVILAAMLAAAVMAPEPAEAGKRSLAFRHSSSFAGAKFHRSHPGLKIDQRSFGKYRHFEQRRFGHFSHGGGALEFDRRGFGGKHRQFMRRHVHDFGRGGSVLKFGGRDVVVIFRQVPGFGPRHDHGDPTFRSVRARHFRLWQDRGFTSKDWHDPSGQFRHFRESVRYSEGGGHGAARPEALLRELEQLGFRDVSNLLSERGR